MKPGDVLTPELERELPDGAIAFDHEGNGWIIAWIPWLHHMGRTWLTLCAPPIRGSFIGSLSKAYGPVTLWSLPPEKAKP